MYADAFGFGVFTVFPIAFAAVGGVLALAAGKPDEPKPEEELVAAGTQPATGMGMNA